MNSPIRILLVDDSPYFLNAAREYLDMQGAFEISGMAVEGGNALEQARQLQPDIILLDLNLGEQSGIRLIPLFKQYTPNSRIIVLTIMDGEGYQITAQQAGADAFVVKTRMTQELVVKILEVLQNRIPQDEPAARPADLSIPFLRMIEHAGDLIYRYEFSPKRGFTYVNPAATALTGYTPEEHYADPDLGFKLVHPQDRPILEAAAQGRIDPNQPLVLRWVRKDGSAIWTEQRNVNLFDETGNLVAIEGIARDITERKQAEIALKNGEENYRSLAETSDSAIAVLDRDGVILYANPAAIRVWQEPRLIGRKVHDLYPAEFADRYLAVIRRVIAEQTVDLNDLETRVRGQVMWFRVSISPLKNSDGSVNAVLLNATDTTHYKRAEASLQANERFNRETLDALNVNIAILDENGLIVAVNRAWREFARSNGMGPALVSEGADYLTVCDTAVNVDSEEACNAAAGIRAVMRGERDFFSLEYPCHSPDEQRWFMMQVTRFGGEGPVRVVVAHENITERKFSEQTAFESESRYRELFMSNPHAMWVYDLETLGFLAVNDAAILHYGYARDEFLAMTIKDIRPPEDVTALLENIAQVADGSDEAGIWRHIKKNGEVIHVEITSHVLDFDGRRSEMVLAHDVTKRQGAEEALRESEIRYRTIFDGAQEAIFVESLAGDILDVNESACRMFGWTRDEFMQKKVGDLVPQGHKALMFDENGQGGLTESFTETVNRRANGEVFPVEISGRTLTLGGRPSLLVVARDISERQRAGEQIKRRVVELEALYQSGVAFSQTLDPQEIGAKMVEVLGQFLNWHHAAVRVRRGEGPELDLLAFSRIQSPQDEERFSSAITHVGQGMAGWVIENGESIRSNNIAQDPRYRATFAGMVSGIYIPIRIQGKTLGCISAESEIENAFGEDDERLLNTLAGQAAVALENARLFQDLQRELRDRTQMEAAIKESEERYRSLIEQIPALVYLDDACLPEPKTIFVSPRIREMLGYETGEWLAGGYELWVRSIHPDDRDRVIHHYLDSIENGSVYLQEYRMFRSDGSMIWVRDTAETQRDLQGQPLKMQGVIYDITENKNAGAALRLQSAALEAAANAIVIADVEGVIQWVNPAFTRLTGYAIEDALGNHTNILFSGMQDRAFYKNLWDTILAGKVWHGELVNKRKDGSLYHEEQTITPLTDSAGRITHFIGVKQDITDRRLAEEKIRQQVEHLSALREIDQAISSSFDMKLSLRVILAKTLKLLKVDAAAVLLLNHGSGTLEFGAGQGFRTRALENTSVKISESYAGEAVINRSMVAINDLSVEPDHKFLTGFLKGEGFASYYGLPLIVKGQVIGVLEVFHREVARRDQAWLDFFNTLAGQAAIAIDNAQLFTASQRELAERRMAEDKLRDSHAELEKRIEERTADLRQVNFELERALRVKDEFLANMSHELRTPLNAVIGLSDSLVEQTAGSLNEKQEKYVVTIRESGQHLLELINDILDLAKIEAGQLTLNQDTIDVATLCQASLRMVRQLALKKNQEVSIELDTDLETIRADERRLKQMIVNLLGNAVKFTPEKGRLGLQVRGDRENNLVRFTVWDTGIGIEENDLPRLFKPFVQLDSNLARKSSGTGLGLALVAKMASMHGGSVGVESQPGVGSRFTVTLPWITYQAGEAYESQTTAKFQITKPLATNKNYTILLVDDTEEVVLLLRDYLEYAGFKVVTARHGLDGIAQAEALNPSLILMDIQMPVMDGLEAARRIRAVEALQRTPIIALTALAMKGDREHCLAAGMNDYISKPVNLRALIPMIQNQLSRATEAAQS